MDSLINKITLYDLTAMTLPGAILSLIIISLVPNEFKQINKAIDNGFIIGILFFLISYCIGWILSQLSKCLFYMEKNYKKKYSLSFIPIIILLISMIIMACFLQGDNSYCIKLFVSTIIIILYFICIILFPNKQKDKEKIQNDFLIKEGYKALKEYYGDNNLTEENLVKYLAPLVHGLIQTDQKYIRIHNYSSSKSFSKNLAGACLFLGIYFLYNFLLSNGIRFDIIYFLAYLLSIIAVIVLQFRYKFFEDKMNILNITYFIDFVKSRKQ
ncbi:hypothetical protein [Thomasclavelia spiroformis]|uniref:hypothetical protein n=1 Tax=Thomasclavelia spiroformis TaxID=29348 RepID=UPI00265F4A07|nr:hypothetical protein [Thomasclavelia spiroformis]